MRKQISPSALKSSGREAIAQQESQHSSNNLNW